MANDTLRCLNRARLNERKTYYYPTHIIKYSVITIPVNIGVIVLDDMQKIIHVELP